MGMAVLLPIQGGSSQFSTITYDVIGGFHQCLYGEYVINLIILLCSKHSNNSICNFTILIKYLPPPSAKCPRPWWVSRKVRGLWKPALDVYRGGGGTTLKATAV